MSTVDGPETPDQPIPAATPEPAPIELAATVDPDQPVTAPTEPDQPLATPPPAPPPPSPWPQSAPPYPHSAPPWPQSGPPGGQPWPPQPYPPSAPPHPHSAPPYSAPPWPYSAPPGSQAWPPPPGWPVPAAPPTKRRWITAAISAGAALLAVIAMGVGAVIINRIRSGPAPAPVDEVAAVPEVGVCYRSNVHHLGDDELRTNAEKDEAVPCDEEHSLETIAAGELEETRPSAAFNREVRDRYAECAQAAHEYLGMHWRTAHVWLMFSLPSSGAWRDGARWYRCDLTGTETFYLDGGVTTTGRMSDTVQPLTCVTWVFSGGDDAYPYREEVSDCDTPHEGEVAGAFDAGDIDRSRESDFFDRVAAKCEAIVEDFLGQSTLHYELSFWYWYPADELVADQSALCIVSAAENGRAFTGSLKGIGDDPIPFA